MANIDIQKRFGSIVRTLRKKHGMTQTNLAEALGLNDETISNIERGRASTRISTAAKIAETFNVPMKDLFNFLPEEKTDAIKHNALQDIKDILADCDEVTIKAIIQTAKTMAGLKK